MAAKKDTSRDDIHTLDSTTAGEVKLAEDVVASIAAIAAGEVEGVSAMTGNFSDRLKHSVGIRTGAGTGVRVIIAGNMSRHRSRCQAYLYHSIKVTVRNNSCRPYKIICKQTGRSEV